MRPGSPTHIEDAYVGILFGDRVSVSSDDKARSLLRWLGLDEDEIEERIQFSHTGSVNTAV